MKVSVDHLTKTKGKANNIGVHDDNTADRHPSMVLLKIKIKTK